MPGHGVSFLGELQVTGDRTPEQGGLPAFRDPVEGQQRLYRASYLSRIVRLAFAPGWHLTSRSVMYASSLSASPEKTKQR